MVDCQLFHVSAVGKVEPEPSRRTAGEVNHLTKSLNVWKHISARKQKEIWNWNDRDKKKKIQVGNQNYDFLSLNYETWSHNYKIESQKYDLYWIIYSLSSHNCEKKSNILLTISCFCLFNPKYIYISHFWFTNSK